MTKTIGDLSGVTTGWLHEFAEIARAELAGEELTPERRAFVAASKEAMEAEMRRRGSVLRVVTPQYRAGDKEGRG